MENREPKYQIIFSFLLITCREKKPIRYATMTIALVELDIITVQ
jgi:hypothetical protein